MTRPQERNHVPGQSTGVHISYPGTVIILRIVDCFFFVFFMYISSGLSVTHELKKNLNL